MIGLSGSRGRCSPSHGSGTTIVSSGRGTVTLRTAAPRTSASACATVGGPASAATAFTSREMPASTRRRTAAGARFSSRRNGERARARRALGAPRVAAVQPGRARTVEHEREPDDGSGAQRAPIRARSRGAIPSRIAGSSSDTAVRGADRPRRARVEQRGRAAVEHRLARADRDHEVGVDERRMDAVDAAVDLQRAEVLGLAVVDGDAPAEARARSGRRSCSSSRRPARRPSPPATSTVRRSRGTPCRSSSSSTAASASRRGSSSAEGSGSDGGWTTIVARPPRGASRLERLAGERVAERLGDRRPDVRERVERRRRGEQERVVGQGHEREARARVQRDARHAGQAIARNRR